MKRKCKNLQQEKGVQQGGLIEKEKIIGIYNEEKIT